MKKKISALMLALALLMSLAACKKNSDAAQAESGTPSGPNQQQSQTEPNQQQPQVSDSAESGPQQSQTFSSAKPEDSSSHAFLPLELKEYGYGMTSSGYMYIAVVLHNPNKDYCVESPSFRAIAKDAGGHVLGSAEQTLSIIYPQQDFCYAGQFFKVEGTPAAVNIEILAPKETQIVSLQNSSHPPYTPLTISNLSIRDTRMTGEIGNANDFDVDSAIVSVVYRDDSGKIVGGDSTFINQVSASATAPFDFSIPEDLATNSYEVYVNIW